MLQKIFISFAVIALLAACAASQTPPLPTGEGTGVRETATPTPTQTLAPTETLTPTPEPTATPEPTVIQKEAIFDLTTGGTLSLPGFFFNKLEGEPTEEEKIKLLDTAFAYIVKDGIDWTIPLGLKWEDASENLKNDILKLKPIVGILPIGGSTVPYNMEGKGNTFTLGFASVTNNGVEGTLLQYYTDEGGYSAVYVQMEVYELLGFLRENMVTIPPKP